MRMMSIGGLIALAVAVMAGAAAAGPVVRIDSGPVEGDSAGGLNIFRGIPYAAPPVGPLRWRPTQAPAPWTTPRRAHEFGAACPQPSRGAAAGGGREATHQDEDCLTLNVWAPANARHLPVMVWIHGGAHRVGASSFPIYDGSHFAHEGVILVSINYRLGLLGYFAHPALTREAGANAPIGNYGFMDQIAALEWVRRNIAAFGGDAHNVTVFGESAGGESIIYLLASPRARGLFDRAIVESGGGINLPPDLAHAEQAGVAAAARLGLPADATAEQLRALPASAWVTGAGPLEGIGFGEFVDGRLITEAPWRAFLAGRAADVPLIIGANSNEASVMFALGAHPDLTRFAGPQLDAMHAAYGHVDDQEMTRQAMGDVAFVAPARFIALAEAGGAPSFLYHFAYVPPARRGSTPGAGHGSEVPFVFNTWDAFPMAARLMQPADHQMERTMISCWTSFARSGRPVCDGAPAWPAYTSGGDRTMVFGAPTTVQTGFRKPQLDFIMSRVAAGRAQGGASAAP